MTAQEVYEHEIKQLPSIEQLRLASLILEQLTRSAKSQMELSDAWSEQDMSDLVAFSMRYAQQEMEGEGDAQGR